MSTAVLNADLVGTPETDPAGQLDARTVAVLDAGPGIPLIPLGPATLARLACEALVQQAADPAADDPARTRETDRADALDTGDRPVQHRFATAPQRRALLRRDGGCAFPGCPRRRSLHAHHVIPWSRGGPTTLANLILLCEHHHLLMHEGGWQLAADPPREPGTATGGRPETAGGRGRWTAIGPDGRTLAAAPTTSGDPAGAERHHAADIAPRTISGTWAGEPLDLAYAVAVLA